MNRPIASSEGVRSRMQKQAVKDTRPELAVRQALHAHGLRYRLHRPIPGMTRRTIDIALVRHQIAIFVDGCFWHGCKRHSSTPKSNADWWVEKIAKNRARDRETDRYLRKSGWTVIRVWEHDSIEGTLGKTLAAISEK